MKKKVVISCGPIPARLDSVKFLTNRFKGGLAFKTAAYLAAQREIELTIVKWMHTEDNRMPEDVNVVNVNDVMEYYEWFKNNAANYDAFIMAAAVANLMPSEPYANKFPSHLYRVGEQFEIKFEIAPRAIDIIKQINPRATLIGYKLFDTDDENELIDIARHTMRDAKANIVFANTPREAASKKIAVMPDNSVIHCDFADHLKLMHRAIMSEYFHTEIVPVPSDKHAKIRFAKAIVKMFEKTFNGYGTVAVPVGIDDMFVTTARGHNGDPVLVKDVNIVKKTVYAEAKATLNVPLLSSLRYMFPRSIIIHRHEDDPNYVPENKRPYDLVLDSYLFPGTYKEVTEVKLRIINAGLKPPFRIKLAHHGDISVLRMDDIDWSRYYSTFPKRYFETKGIMLETIRRYNHGETLEVGGNTQVMTKYAYDRYVNAENAQNLTWGDIVSMKFDLTIIRNAINYLTPEEIRCYIERSSVFIANTFFEAPDEKVTDTEAVVYDGDMDVPEMRHALRLPLDGIIKHSFYAYSEDFWKSLGLKITRYGANSVLLTKGVDDI